MESAVKQVVFVFCGSGAGRADLLATADIHLLPQRALDPDTRYLMVESARRYAEEHLHVDAVLGRLLERMLAELAS